MKIGANFILTLCALGLVLSGCDKLRSFVLVNRTNDQLSVTYQILDKDNKSVREQSSYEMAPGTAVDTAKQPDLAGQKRHTIFNTRHLTPLTAQAGNHVR